MKSNTVRKYLYLIFMLVFLAETNAQTNILANLNGDFEKGNTENWRYLNVIGGAVNYLSAEMFTDAHGGAFAAKVTWEADPAIQDLVFDQLPMVSHGIQYTFKAWAKSLNGPFILRIHAVYYDNANNIIADFNDESWILTNVYTQHTFALPNVPVGATKVNVGFRACNSNGSRWPATTVSCLIDDVQLIDPKVYADNLLVSMNGDFEKGSIDNWRFLQLGTSEIPSATTMSTDTHSGNYAAQVTWASNIDYSEIIGSSHVIPRYYFGSTNCLNEGADRLLEMGSKVIKIWYYQGSETPDIMYPWNSTWPKVNSLVEGLNNTYYSELFDKPFKTFVLNTASFVNTTNAWYWKDNLNQTQIDQEEAEFYEFTKALLKKYEGTGKTFIFTHHEGDWHTRGNTDTSIDPTPGALTRMTSWLNARQRGVNNARKEVKAANVFVFNAAEINLVVMSMQNDRPNIVNKVLPFTNLDLVSYSCYDACFQPLSDPNTTLLKDALVYIKKMMPDSEVFGDNNVFIGEWGIPENDFTADQIKTVMTNTVTDGIEAKCPYIIYWQLYCNEIKAGISAPVKLNTDVRGFWLIRPDGTKTWQYDYLKEMCTIVK